MDNTNNKKLPTFLSDKPSDRNSFGDNTTFKINKTILSNIINNNDNNNKIIALTGKWGAGKNTVIEMLKTYDKENIEVVEFDTLSLDNNQIRRSFLLNLYNKLIRKDKKEIKFEPKEKSELENYISGNIKETTIKSNIKLLNTTKILIIIAFIFITLISVHNIINILSDIIFKYMNCPIWILDIVIIVIVGLIIIGIILSLILFDKILFDNEKIKNLLEKIILAIFPFVNIPSDLLEKSQEKTENNDITSDDFKDYYHVIIDSYEEKKKIALVIDNLDRIDAKKSMDIIYNLHLFMSANENEEESKNKKEKYKNIYFIILIDKEKFFERNNDNDSNFFEKIFPIRLEISGIVNLNWRKFFSDKIDEVFKEMKIDSDIIMQSISLYEEFSLSNIVPRDIIYFINKVVYNYIVMIEGSIENIDNTGRIIKASILNACYSMFVEERKNIEIKNNNKTCKYDIQKFVYNIKNNDNNKDNISKNINKLLSKYDEDWETLLYKSYFQTSNPYDALYLADLEHYILNFTKEKIQNLKKDIEDDNIFNELLKKAINKLDANLELKNWINIVNIIIEYSNKSDDYIKIIFEKYNYDDNTIEGIGDALAKIYNQYSKNEDVISNINGIIEKHPGNLDEEYISCYDAIEEKEKDKFLASIKFTLSKEFPEILLEKYKENELCKEILSKNNFTFDTDYIKEKIDNIVSLFQKSNLEKLDIINNIKYLKLIFLYVYYGNIKNDIIVDFFNRINGSNFYKKNYSNIYRILLDIFFHISNNNPDLLEKTKIYMNNILKFIYSLEDGYYNYIYSTILLLQLNLLSETYKFNNNLFNEYFDKCSELQNDNIKISNLVKNISSAKNPNFKNLTIEFYKLIMENIEQVCKIEDKIISSLGVSNFKPFLKDNKFTEFIRFIHEKYNNDLEKYMEIIDNEDELEEIADNIGMENSKEFDLILKRFKKIYEGKEAELFKKKPEGLFKKLIFNEYEHKLGFINYEFESRIKDAFNSLSKESFSLIKVYIDKIYIIFNKNDIEDINGKLCDIDISLKIDVENIEILTNLLKILNRQEINISKVLKYCISYIDNKNIDVKCKELFEFFEDLIKDKKYKLRI